MAATPGKRPCAFSPQKRPSYATDFTTTDLTTPFVKIGKGGIAISHASGYLNRNCVWVYSGADPGGRGGG